MPAYLSWLNLFRVSEYDRYSRFARIESVHVRPSWTNDCGAPGAFENIANLVTAGVRLVPLGQTDGQLAIAELEGAVVATSRQAKEATITDLGSAAFMVDLASMAHETQYTRLFRS